MRTRAPWALTAMAGAVALALAGCADPPEGVDGDLAGGWTGFSAPVSFTPQAPVCHEEAYRPAASIELYRPVDCEQPHFVETVHVGTFDEVAELDSPPQPDSSTWRSAYSECEERVADYLGADYRYGRLWLGVAAPSDAAWNGGARWFRCDLTELASVDGEPVARTGSLADALAEPSSELRLGCFRVDVDDDGVVEEQAAVSCDEPHHAEFVGVWRADAGSYPDGGAGSDAAEEVYDGCRSRIADYTDVPDDGAVRYRVGAIADWMSEQDWQGGDRAFRCRLYVTDGEVTESLEGAGTDALPVRTE